MLRERLTPRANWQRQFEELGFHFHSLDDVYWDESACYQFSSSEIDMLEEATWKMHELCLKAVDHVISKKLFKPFALPGWFIEYVVDSWEADDPSLYGRFDFRYDGINAPKLLEYNADTPTALLEAAVVQWFWLQDTRPTSDQFNSIHERLIAAWQRWGGKALHFSAIKEHPEDEQTVLYLRDTAEQAGVATQFIHVEDIGWNGADFVDLAEAPIAQCFKLYPWEWLWHEEFGAHLARERTRFIEPTWKMLLSNKGLLPILWELFPGHPNLLPAYEAPEPLGQNFIKKPKLSREGANITLVREGKVAEEAGGDYGAEGFVYQALAPSPDFAGNHPIFGVWVVDHAAAGLGIREDTRRITGNLSRFVPHFFN
mgnify:CR=1 FL=1